MKFIVETRGLGKEYGKKAVVRDLDLKVPKACVYGFMGPNGAGKSTTMKMLLGLIKSSSGGSDGGWKSHEREKQD